MSYRELSALLPFVPFILMYVGKLMLVEVTNDVRSVFSCNYASELLP